MMYNNGIYHDTMIPITTAVKNNHKVRRRRNDYCYNQPGLYVPAPNPHKVSGHKAKKGNKGFNNDQNVDRCSLEALLREVQKCQHYARNCQTTGPPQLAPLARV
jgi:hypothetical protein